MTWTQPVCDPCWIFFHPGRIPARLVRPKTETCCNCGESTESGLYIRVDPATVKYPTEEQV